MVAFLGWLTLITLPAHCVRFSNIPVCLTVSILASMLYLKPSTRLTPSFDHDNTLFVHRSCNLAPTRRTTMLVDIGNSLLLAMHTDNSFSFPKLNFISLHFKEVTWAPAGFFPWWANRGLETKVCRQGPGVSGVARICCEEGQS